MLDTLNSEVSFSGAAVDFGHGSTCGLCLIVDCLGKERGWFLVAHAQFHQFPTKHNLELTEMWTTEDPLETPFSSYHMEMTGRSSDFVTHQSEVSKSDCQELTLVRMAEESQDSWEWIVCGTKDT